MATTDPEFESPRTRADTAPQAQGLPGPSNSDIIVPPEFWDRRDEEAFVEAVESAFRTVSAVNEERVNVGDVHDATNHASELAASGDYPAAITLLRTFLHQLGPSISPVDSRRVRATVSLAVVLQAQGEHAQGERAIAELLEASRILGGPSHRDLGLLTLQLGELLMAQQRFAEAAGQFMTSSSAFLLAEGPRSVHYCMAGVDTAEALHASGQFSSMPAFAETLVDADAIATLPSMMWKLRAAKALRLCGSAADAARRLSQFSPGTGETVQWREELAACRWWAGLFKDAYVDWGEAYSHAASSTDLGPVASRIGANLALHELSQGKLEQVNARLVEAEARTDASPLPILMMSVTFLAGAGKSADWLRGVAGKAFTGDLRLATQEHERRYGRHHPLSGTVRNLWAVALMLGSDWSGAATILEDSNLESGYGVEGYDLVAATLALNAFLASVVLRRRQPAVTYFERVYRATASCPHHPFRRAADRARLELGVFAEPPPPERVVRALLLLPLA